jgi:NTP pyrophosphatase (non-canonical NTP hydrolase)
MNEFNTYQENALRTCSPSFFGEDFELTHFTDLLDTASKNCEELDHYKRALFYDNRDKYALGGSDPLELDNQSDIDLVHSIIGIVTETGEIGSALVTALDEYRNNLGSTKLVYDETNMREELGDLLWYIAVGCKALNVDMSKVAERNIEKLAARYPEKFTSEKALNRNHDAERAILEQK